MDKVTGGCLCGQLRIEAQGRPRRVGLCHCLDCRKHHGALFGASAMFAEQTVSISGEASNYGDRYFCPHSARRCSRAAVMKWRCTLGHWTRRIASRRPMNCG